MSTNHSLATEKHISHGPAKNYDRQASPEGHQPIADSDSTLRTPLRPEESLVAHKPAGSGQPLYNTLREYHLQRVMVAEDGTQRSARYLANHNSVINSWMAHELKLRGLPQEDSACKSLVVGDELGVGFTDSLAGYLTQLDEDGYSPNTLNDRKSILWSVHDSAVDLIKSRGLPESFHEALSVLIRNSGKSLNRIAAEANTRSTILSGWATGVRLPGHISLPTVERLEDVFHVPRGTLKVRLIHLIHHDGGFKSCATPWRQHLGKLLPYVYKLNTFTPTLEAEFKDIVRFFTDDVWLEAHGFDRNSEWRVDPDGRIPTADRVRLDISGFMGFAILPPNPEVPWQNGLGMSPDRLSLALMSDIRLLLSYVDFKRGRSYLNSFNTTTVVLLHTCASWLREGTGFLRQQPEYGSKLPDPVAPERWDSWCESNRERILKFLKTIKKSKNHPVVMTRDPFAAVRQFIEDLEHPISILFEMVDNMKRMIPLLRNGNPIKLARHVRDTFYGEFITSYPLRVKNFSRMKFCPWAQTDDSAPELAHEDDINLYRKSDGRLWIRYVSGEMKNGKAVDIPVSQSVVPLLEEYIFVHRPVLNKAIKDAINSRRAKFGMSPLTADEERAIESSPYVFRPSTEYIRRMDAERLASYTGTEPLPEDSLSERMLRMSQRFIPNCKGFSPHAVRALVASEYIKNHPNGWPAAAAALNDTEATVRKHYAWVRPCDKIKPWQEYHEELKRQCGGGGSSSPAAAVAA